MMVMPANTTGLEVGYLAGRYPGSIGHLYSPGAERGPWDFLPYALDNGAFVAWQKRLPFDEVAWRRLLHWAARQGQRPLWVLLPDVVGDRDATLARYYRYLPEVLRYGFRPAVAVQDRMRFEDVESDAVLFLGGTTEWKLEAIGPWCRRFPGRVHVGRVNTWARLIACWRAGAISVDGTGWFHRQQRAELTKFLREIHERSAA